MGHRLGLVALASVLASGVFAASAGRAAAQPDPDDPGEIEMEPEPEPEPGPGPDAAPEPDPAAKAEAKKLLAGGNAFFKKGNRYKRRKRTADAAAQYERALAAYSKAYDLVPNPQIFYPIATAEQELERWVDAATHYRAFLRDATDADPKLRTEVEQRLEAVKLNLGVLRMTVEPEGAAITVDGKPLGTAPLADPVYLAPGTYTLSFTADGFQPLEQEVSIEAGSESERTFELDPVPVIVEPPRPPPKPEVVELPRGPSRMALYVTGGLTLAMVGTATATGILAIGKHGTFTDTSLSMSARNRARDSGKTLALVTDGMIVGTLVAAGIGAYYYAKVYKPKQREHARKLREIRSGARPVATRPKILVAPWVQADGGGLSVVGELR